ncbi:MAG TPA: formylglycine-generating enzyme family protein, partial [Planctomycetota bacterium]|nr:formylglycine-generating enzyme family protein [Planctomycetota bacterium]
DASEIGQVELAARPEHAPRLRRWLDDGARPLLAERAEVEAARDALRATALPYDATQEAADRARHPRLLALQTEEAELEKLRSFRQRNSGAAMSADLERRLAYASRLQRRSEAKIRDLRRDPGALRSHRFEDPSDRYLHDGLEQLLIDLRSFEAKEVALVNDQLHWAELIRPRSIDDPAEAWRAAAARVASDARFAGVVLQPQLGLVPLGPDPSSGLECFAFARSGSLPERSDAQRSDAPRSDAPRSDDGELRFEATSAIVLVLLPPGEAVVGTEAGSVVGGDEDESPQHRVRLDAFFIGKHEVTQAQWMALTLDEEPSKFKAGTTQGERVLSLRHPVEQVSWERASAVLARHELALPTEVQWEYACRAATSSPWWTGTERASLAGAENLGDKSASRFNAAWHKEGFEDGHYVHAPVGSFRANAFGLHDLHGNVREWCRDFFHPYSEAARPGDGLRSGSRPSDVKVTRGGAFDYDAIAARSARRDAWPANAVAATQGLRVVRPLDSPAPR